MMNSGAVRLTETSTLERILKRPEIHVSLDTKTRFILDRLGRTCRILKRVGLPGSIINGALAETEYTRLLKLDLLTQLKTDVKKLSDGLESFSFVHQDIIEFTNEMNLRIEEQQVSVGNSDEYQMKSLQSQLVQLDESLEKSGAKTFNMENLNHEYNEYLQLVAEAAKYNEKLSKIPVKCGESLEKSDLVTLLQQRKSRLSQLVQEVYQKAS